MIPIRDVQGRVVAFTARKTALTPDDDPAKEAKYINSPETPIFSKGHLLFNLDRARTAIREAGSFLMVEGQLDALRCWSCGIQAAIAPQGTAITQEQLSLLKRYSPSVEVLLDGDAAGQRAAFKMLPKALSAGLEISFLPLSSGDDPDTLLKRGGKAALEALRKKPLSAMQLGVQALMPEPGDASPSGLAASLEQLYSALSGVQSAVAREAYLKEIAELVGATEASVQMDASRVLAQAYPERTSGDGQRTAHKANHTHQGGAFPSAEGQQGHSGVTPLEGASASSPGLRKIISAEEEVLIIGFNYEYLFGQLLGVIDPDWIDSDALPASLLSQMLCDYHEGLWDGAEDFIERLETPESRSYASQLCEMGICVLDFRCDGDFMRRDILRAAKNMEAAWEPEEVLRSLVLALLRNHIDRTTQKLNQNFLNLSDSQQQERARILAERKSIRQVLNKQRQFLSFSA